MRHDGYVESDVVVKLSVDLDRRGNVEIEAGVIRLIKSREILLEDLSFHQFGKSEGDADLFEFSRHDEIELSVIDHGFRTHTDTSAEAGSVSDAGDERAFRFRLAVFFDMKGVEFESDQADDQ